MREGSSPHWVLADTWGSRARIVVATASKNYMKEEWGRYPPAKINLLSHTFGGIIGHEYYKAKPVLRAALGYIGNRIQD